MEYFSYMKLPEALHSDNPYGLCYEKKVIVMETTFLLEGINGQLNIIAELLDCMQRSNIEMQYEFPFYQLKVRPTHIDERPAGICFELRWGNREELSKEKE